MDFYEALRGSLAEELRERFPHLRVEIDAGDQQDVPDHIWFADREGFGGAIVIMVEDAELVLLDGPVDYWKKLLTVELSDPDCVDKLFGVIAEFVKPWR